MKGVYIMNSKYAPSFIRAKTPNMLRKRMLKVQEVTGSRFLFQDIQYANGFWYTWFVVREGINIDT